MRAFVISVIVGILILGGLGNAFALNPDYLGSNIAQKGDIIATKTLTGVHEPHIADNGDVIFIGDFSGGSAIFLVPSDGSPPSVLVESPGVLGGQFFDELSDLSINDNGDIVFVGKEFGGFATGIFNQTSVLASGSGFGFPQLFVLDTTNFTGVSLRSVSLPSINNNGDVVFLGSTDSLFSNNLILLNQPSLVPPGFPTQTGSLLADVTVPIDGITLSSFGAPFINNNGDVVSSGSTSGGSTDVIFQVPSGSSPSVLVKTGTIIDGYTFSGLDLFISDNQYSINDNGEVVYSAFSSDGPDGSGGSTLGFGIFNQTNLLVAAVTLIDGNFPFIFTDISINDNGDLLFLGDIGLDDGIFTSTNLIALPDDRIDDNTLTTVGAPSMNNHGDIVFVADTSMADIFGGTTINTGIYLASLPEIGSLQCGDGTTSQGDECVVDPNLTQQIIDLEANLTNLFTNNLCDPPAGTIQEVLDCITNLDTDLTNAESALITAENDRDAALDDLNELFTLNSCDPPNGTIFDVLDCIDNLITDLANTSIELATANAKILELESADMFPINFVQPILEAVGISDVADDASLTRTLERSLSTAERADGVACKGVVSFIDDVNQLEEDGLPFEDAETLRDSAAALLTSCGLP